MNICFAERLKLSLKTNNISQAELAKRINMSADIISCYCLGKRLPSIDALILICKELNESADYLIGLTD